jgi:hypothetical protein
MLKYDHYMRQLINIQVYFESPIQLVIQIYLYHSLDVHYYRDLRLTLITISSLVIFIGLMRRIHVKSVNNSVLKLSIKTIMIVVYILSRLVIIGLFQSLFPIEVYLVYYVNISVVMFVHVIEMKVQHTNALGKMFTSTNSKLVFVKAFNIVKVSLVFSMFGINLFSYAWIKKDMNQNWNFYCIFKLVYHGFYYVESGLLVWLCHYYGPETVNNRLTIGLCASIGIAMGLTCLLACCKVDVSLIDINLNANQSNKIDIVDDGSLFENPLNQTRMTYTDNDKHDFRLGKIKHINSTNSKHIDFVHQTDDVVCNLDTICFAKSQSHLIFLNSSAKILYIYNFPKLNLLKTANLVHLNMKQIGNVCVNDTSNEIFISDCLVKKIFILNSDYEYKRCIDANELVTFDLIALDADINDVYLVDWKNSQLLKMDSNGCLRNKIFIKFSDKSYALIDICIAKSNMYFLCEKNKLASSLFIAEKLYLNLIYKFEFSSEFYNFTSLRSVKSHRYLLLTCKKKVCTNQSNVSDFVYLCLFDCFLSNLCKEIILDNVGNGVEDVYYVDDKLFVCRTKNRPLLIKI